MVENFRLALVFISRPVRSVTLTIIFVPAFVAVRLTSPALAPQLLRWYLQTGGAVFVKFGQILAMRYDLLPEAYCEELSKLLDRLPAVSIDRIIPVIERDLQRPLADCYSEFKVTPLASASIAQVHSARLLNGTHVVVKVMHPGVRRLFRIDLIYVRFAGWFLDTFGFLGNISARRIVNEVIECTREELDFRREARNIEFMHKRMQEDDIDHYAPQVYPSLCGRFVITMERLQGVSVNEMLTAIDAGNEELLESWAAAGITPRRTARLLMRSILEQSLRHRLFHADPHAANLILMNGGTLGWVDFGMLGWLDERLWAHQFKLREAVAANKIHAAYHHLLATLEPIPLTDLSVFEVEAKEYLREWIASSESSVATISEKSSGYFFVRIFAALRRAKLTLPLGLTRLYRTIIIADMVMLKLDPQMDWLPVMKDFITDEQRRRIALLVTETFNPFTLSSLVMAGVNAPRTALSVGDWVENQLPEMGRPYRQPMTRFERMIATLLRYSQLLIGLIVTALLAGRFLAPRFPDTGWLRLGGAAAQSYWPIPVLMGVGLLLLLQKIMHEFHKPTLR